MRLARQLAGAALLLAGTFGVTGCELIAQPDRSQIPDGQGVGGQGVGGQGVGGQGAGGEGGVGDGGSGGSGGQGGQGGSGGGCTDPLVDCPTPQNECEEAVCTNDVCATAPKDDGTPVAAQTAGDCQSIVCDGAGGTHSIADDNDAPVDDGTLCTVESCNAGVPATVDAGAGTVCSDNGGALCDGAGTCVECIDASDCPATGVCTANVCTAACNDGVVNGTELCDDGNNADCDGCRGDCSAVETGCGDGFQCGTEACDDGNADNTDACVSCASASCGDTFVQAGVEECDDGNADSTDACVSCANAYCGDAFVQAGVEGCDDGNATSGDGCSATCAIESICGDGAVTGSEACDDGNASSCDGCRGDCTAVETGCGDGFQCGTEACDDGNTTNGDGCDNNCTVSACGNGVVSPTEGCDDGDAIGGDGCSAACLVETGFSCAGEPSACTQTAELQCNDGIDNDGDSLTDCGDTDCALGCSPAIPACPSPLALVVYNSADVPKAIDDSASVDSLIQAGIPGLVGRAVVGFDITHTYDGDVDVSLLSPAGGAALDLSSDNGSFGEDYTATILADACATAVTAGAAPFTGCFRPEAALGVLALGDADGTWTFTSADDASGDTGTLNSWSLALCVAPATCGDGVTDPGEACDDGNTDDTDACLSTCVAASCGDGHVQAGTEQCDDSNAAGGDCCSSSCQIEPQCVGESEPNGTCGQEDGPFTPSPTVIYRGALTPVGDQDIFSFTLPATASVRVESFSGSATGACDGGIDTVVELRGADCTTVLVSNDEGGINSCSLINPTVDAAARQLPPGTYFVRTEEYLNNGTIAAYNVQVTLVSLCGNTVIEPFEACDDGNLTDGDGCEANCTLTPICGDGLVTGTEQCDDGGMVPGDGCDASCAVEPGYQCGGNPSTCVPAEVEPNDTFADADARALDATPVVITGDDVYGGAISPVGDLDTYQMVLAADSQVHLEVFDGTGVNCAGGITTTLTLFDAAQVQLYSDTTRGIASCSAMTVNLVAGTYYVRVGESGNNGSISAYRLQVKVQGSAGDEVEVNDARVEANALAGSDVCISGGHQVNTDSDYFMITLPATASIRAEVIEGSGAETCESNGIDSRVTLYNAIGTQLADVDDAGRGYCTLMDGTGVAPVSAQTSGARNLAAGTYYLQVRASASAQSGVGGQFDYRLCLTIR
ncbi:MAG: DUF4215 domain-containing protein [Polyangiaceae bacterium]|nr:DUF4215 domain-containing protein [Polyangiaceae bacterium]